MCDSSCVESYINSAKSRVLAQPRRANQLSFRAHSLRNKLNEDAEGGVPISPAGEYQRDTAQRNLTRRSSLRMNQAPAPRRLPPSRTDLVGRESINLSSRRL